MGKKEYHIWRYVTENTIPKAADGQIFQRNGISTGIVFKGKMIATEDAEPGLKKAINEATGNSSDDPILYAHGDNLFVSWTEVRKYAINNKEADPIFYKAVFGTPDKKTPVAEKEVTEGSEAVEAIYSDDSQSPDYKWNVWHNEKNIQKTVMNLNHLKRLQQMLSLLFINPVKMEMKRAIIAITTIGIVTTIMVIME